MVILPLLFSVSEAVGRAAPVCRSAVNKSLLFASLCPDGLVKCNGSPLCKTRTHLKIHPALFIPNPHIRSTDAGQGKLTGVHDTSGLEQNGLRGFYGDGIFGFRLKSADLTLTEVKSV